MKNTLRLIAGGLVSALFSAIAVAANLAPAPFSAGSVTGDVTYKLAGTATYLPLTTGTALPQGATIKTGESGTAEVVFASGSVAVIDANSEIEVTKFEQELFSGPLPTDSEPAVSNTEMKVINGGVSSKVNKLKKGSAFTVNTPVGAAGVRGTVFVVSYNSATGKFSVATAEGNVVFTSTAGVSTSVAAGQFFDGLQITGLSAKDIEKIEKKFDKALAKADKNNSTITLPDIDSSLIGVSVN
jgi:hypothetical protein